MWTFHEGPLVTRWSFQEDMVIWWAADAYLDGFLPNIVLRLRLIWAATKTVTSLRINYPIWGKTTQSFCSKFPSFSKVCPINCYIDTGKVVSSYYKANNRRIFGPFHNCTYHFYLPRNLTFGDVCVALEMFLFLFSVYSSNLFLGQAGTNFYSSSVQKHVYILPAAVQLGQARCLCHKS